MCRYITHIYVATSFVPIIDAMSRAVYASLMLGFVVYQIVRYRNILSFFPDIAWPIERNTTQEYMTITETTNVGLSKRLVGDDIPDVKHRSIFAILNTTVKPPLDTFIDANATPTKYIRHLLDYAIVGFAKCGTTSLGEWFYRHPEIGIGVGENYNFRGGLLRMSEILYKSIPMNGTLDKPFINGYRCPHDVQTIKAMRIIADSFPTAKLIVTVRHPVLWFESFYNYRMERGEKELLLGKPNELIGWLNCYRCESPILLSTATGAFHQYLARLGKTNFLSKEERALLDPFTPTGKGLTVKYVYNNPNPVFLMEVSQLGDKDELRASSLRKDLKAYLNLYEDLPPIPHVRPGSTAAPPKNFTRFDICEKEYNPVRTEMMYISRNASLWIRNFFLKSPDVFVSSPDYFDHLLQSWMFDPCDKRKRKRV